MTIPSDIAGLSERLRFDAVRCEVAYSKGVASNIEEAATAIDSLTARVKELEEDAEALTIAANLQRTRAEAAETRALRAEQQRDEAVTALRSVSTQCDNVMFNCEQRPADNERHLSSWRSVKASADSAIRRLASGPEGGALTAASDGEVG